MNKAVRVAAATVTTLGMVGGFAGVVGASPSISNTGPDSYNKVKSHSSWRQRVTNNNSVGVSNNNPQSATSGDVKVKHNTTGGDAASGAASNTSSFSASVMLTNNTPGTPEGAGSGSNDGSIDTTGPDSTNVIKNSTSVHSSVTNNNTVSLSNTNSQSATSGSVKVSDNTTGGDATSGDAMNSSTSSFSINIAN